MLSFHSGEETLVSWKIWTRTPCKSPSLSVCGWKIKWTGGRKRRGLANVKGFLWCKHVNSPFCFARIRQSSQFNWRISESPLFAALFSHWISSVPVQNQSGNRRIGVHGNERLCQPSWSSIKASFRPKSREFLTWKISTDFDKNYRYYTQIQNDCKDWKSKRRQSLVFYFLYIFFDYPFLFKIRLVFFEPFLGIK